MFNRESAFHASPCGLFLVFGAGIICSIFGANRLEFTLAPVPGRGLPESARVSIKFRHGGCGTFLHYFFRIMEKYKQAVRRRVSTVWHRVIQAPFLVRRRQIRRREWLRSPRSPRLGSLNNRHMLTPATHHGSSLCSLLLRLQHLLRATAHIMCLLQEWGEAIVVSHPLRLPRRHPHRLVLPGFLEGALLHERSGSRSSSGVSGDLKTPMLPVQWQIFSLPYYTSLASAISLLKVELEVATCISTRTGRGGAAMATGTYYY